MTSQDDMPRVVHASREIGADAARIFELIAEPTKQPTWDGNDNLSEAVPGQRVHAVGDVFTMTTTKGNVRENHVVEFEEGRLIAWRPAERGQQTPPGHLWRWELEPLSATTTRVTLASRGTATVTGVIRDFRTRAPVTGFRCAGFARSGNYAGNITVPLRHGYSLVKLNLWKVWH